MNKNYIKFLVIIKKIYLVNLKSNIFSQTISFIIFIFLFSYANVNAQNVDLLILIDDSGSMVGLDPFNIRIEAATYCTEFLKNNSSKKNCRIGIIRFGSDAVLSLALSSINKVMFNSLEPIKNNQYTKFDSAINLALSEFERNKSFNVSHIPQILLITDGSFLNSAKEFNQYSFNKIDREQLKRSLISKVRIIIEKFKNHNGVLHVVIIEGNKNDNDEWKKNAFSTGGLFYTVNKININNIRKFARRYLNEELIIHIINQEGPGTQEQDILIYIQPPAYRQSSAFLSFLSDL